MDAEAAGDEAAGAEAAGAEAAGAEATSFSIASSSFGISAITTTDNDATVANASPGPNHGALNQARQPPRVTGERLVDNTSRTGGTSGTRATASRAMRSTCASRADEGASLVICKRYSADSRSSCMS